MNKKRIYISGPMTSLTEEEVTRTFMKGSMEIAMMGYYPVNPHKISGFPFEYEEYMKVDLTILEVCEGIYMLRGWEHSSGARRELKLAREKGLMIMYQEQEMDKDDE